MTPDRWQRIEALFHAAEPLPVAAREAFLLQECTDDVGIREEVASLLKASTSDRWVLDGHAPITASNLIAVLQPVIVVGQTVGAYRVESLLGAGGMGEVYRARDTSLERDVALKVLPVAFMHDPERRARFDREARVLASLHHPGICGIHGIETVGGTPLLILELVEGQTLAELLASRVDSGTRGLSVERVLELARQIAEALELAHDKGVIHRDLKPANIKVTPEGTVKILDFGLAKALSSHGSAPELTMMPGSSDGKRDGPVMGTAAYMSPEQARGQFVDRRTDIWSLGCVIYEMVTGRVAFAGATTSDSIARILEREPDWSALPDSLPVFLRRLLSRMLTKDSRKRMRDVGEVRLEIDAFSEQPPGRADEPAPVPLRRAPRLLWGAVLALAAALVASLTWRGETPSEVAPTRFSHVLPPGQILNGSRGAHIIAVSPDGAVLVYSGTPYGLYVRPMTSLAATLVPGTENIEVSEPTFSPDGRSIAFFTIGERALQRINLAGGAPRILSVVEATPTGIRWEPGGIIYGQGRGGIMRVSAEGGAPERLIRVGDGETAYNPQTLPGGERVMFTLARGTAPSRWDRARIVVESLRDHARTVIVEGGSDARYLPAGYLLYALAGTVYAATFDQEALRVTGERVPVLEGVRRAAGGFTGAAIFSLAANGTLAYVPGPLAGERSAPLDFGVMSRQGTIEPLHLPGGPYARPRVSPDGTRIAFESDDGKEAVVYTYPLSGAQMMQRLTTGGNSRFPVWVSNTAVAFQSDREGDRAVWWQALDGSAERLTRPVAGTTHTPESWFGDTLLYSVIQGTDVSLWAYSFRSRASARLDTPSSSAPTDAVFAPDGRSIAYSVTQGNQMTLYVQGFPTGAPHAFNARVSDTPKHARWSMNGQELCYDPSVSRFECVRITTDPFAFGTALSLPKKLQGAPPGERASYDTMRDGSFLGVITAGHNEFVRGSDTQINVVLNWFQELERRVRH